MTAGADTPANDVGDPDQGFKPGLEVFIRKASNVWLRSHSPTDDHLVVLVLTGCAGVEHQPVSVCAQQIRNEGGQTQVTGPVLPSAVVMRGVDPHGGTGCGDLIDEDAAPLGAFRLHVQLPLAGQEQAAHGGPESAQLGRIDDSSGHQVHAGSGRLVHEGVRSGPRCHSHTVSLPGRQHASRRERHDATHDANYRRSRIPMQLLVLRETAKVLVDELDARYY